MAIIAIVAAGDMTLVFAGCRNTVVTGTATAKDLGVIDGRHRNKCIRGVAVLAGAC